MLSAEYYLKQAEIASRMALAESDPERAKALHVLALELFDKADGARNAPEASRQPELPIPPSIIQRQ